MCDWHDISAGKVRKIRIDAQAIQDACKIIHQAAQKREMLTYTDLMIQLKHLGHRGINRGTVGSIVGEVSIQVSQLTNPSIYPSAIVMRKDSNQPGRGFWDLDTGNNPPEKVPPNQRENQLNEYRRNVFNRLSLWSCDCTPR
jgi:hypothetical protein